ncbi:hypothetical protein C8R47DRAFT_1092518 [Mycena vitilis]|nr:hypothetical protein C8R47DRAFT_1092518 [Mycena vitilis]
MLVHSHSHSHSHPATHTPSPPASAQHSPQSSYTPFTPPSSAPAVAYAPSLPGPGVRAGGEQQYELVYPPYVSLCHPTAYDAPLAPMAPYDVRRDAILGFAQGVVPATHSEKQHDTSPPVYNSLLPLLYRASIESVEGRQLDRRYVDVTQANECEQNQVQQRSSPEQPPQAGYAHTAGTPGAVQMRYPQRLMGLDVGLDARQCLEGYAHQSQGLRVADPQCRRHPRGWW